MADPNPIESDYLRPARRQAPSRGIVIDLSADVGEGQPNDARMMPYLSSISVACGAHAGDAATLRRVLYLGMQHGLGLGAHPGYEDKEHMGRKPLDLPPAELAESLGRQLTLFRKTLNSLGGKWQHVKLHGALYHQAAQEQAVAETVLQVLQEACPRIYLVCQPQGWLYKLAGARGLPVIPEYFADRGYREEGTLIPRGEEGDLLTDPDRVIESVIRLARLYYQDKELPAPPKEKQDISLGLFALPVEETADASTEGPPHPTFCLHGDTPNVLEISRWLRIGLSRAQIGVAPYLV